MVSLWPRVAFSWPLVVTACPLEASSWPLTASSWDLVVSWRVRVEDNEGEGETGGEGEGSLADDSSLAGLGSVKRTQDMYMAIIEAVF